MKWIDALFDKLLRTRLRKSQEPLGGWQPKHVACWTCHITHQLPSNIRQAIASAEDFFTKHPAPTHAVNWFEHPGLAGLWTSNADIKPAYASSAAFTITLASLATSSTLVAGREGTAISNTSNLYDDYLIGGKVTTGTSPTVDTQIEVSVYGGYSDTPTYIDVLDGTDSAETFTSVNVKRSAVRIIERMFVDNTSDRTYGFGPVGVKQAFGGIMPKNFGPFVTHSTAVNLNSTGGNHEIVYTGVYATVI